MSFLDLAIETGTALDTSTLAFCCDRMWPKPSLAKRDFAQSDFGLTEFGQSNVDGFAPPTRSHLPQIFVAMPRFPWISVGVLVLVLVLLCVAVCCCVCWGCADRPPPDRPKFRALIGRGFTRQPKNPNRAHLRALALQTTKIQREDIQTKRAKMGAEEGKKARNFGLPPLRPPLLGPPLRTVLHPSPPPPPSPLPGPPTSDWPKSVLQRRPKSDWPNLVSTCHTPSHYCRTCSGLSKGELQHASCGMELFLATLNR